MNTFGKRIKNLRQKIGITQVELGKMLNVTDLAVTKWESDASLPNTITLIKIADYFNVSIDYLLCRRYNHKEKNICHILVLIITALKSMKNILIIYHLRKLKD